MTADKGVGMKQLDGGRVLRLSEWVLIWRLLILCNSTDFRYEIRQIHQSQCPMDYDQTNQHPPRKNRRKGLVATKASSCCKLVNNGCYDGGGFIKTGQHFLIRRGGMKDTDGFYRWKRCFHSFLMGLGSGLMNHLVPLREKKSEGNVHPVTFNRFFFFWKGLRFPNAACGLQMDMWNILCGCMKHSVQHVGLLQNMTWTKLKKYISQQIFVGLLFEAVVMLIKSHQMDP